ncbi:ribosome maturation factor RimP [Jeongeupia chitinilytica]|uniref:Ribosome maturation factor RimP n=1 Tax=Jeongeupia chitinilytica TaxID=1041641 RepID=A0ABQ3GYJ9_9NEIS|nr:ribosome maturation factor RimP [Jeongeupia chitinilytica]GHD59958.1 ribosome maturation factor RimP [Jeongeupia chitinilytica]
MAANVQSVLDATLPGLGYELVDLELAHNGLVRVFIDKPGGITVDDCVTVSNHLTRLFMVEEVPYERLEVSSPGVDRPLTKPEDFTRFAGEKVRIKLRLPLPDKRKKLLGTLIGLEDGAVVVDVDGERLALPLTQIDKVRLEPQF